MLYSPNEVLSSCSCCTFWNARGMSPWRWFCGLWRWIELAFLNLLMWSTMASLKSAILWSWFHQVDVTKSRFLYLRSTVKVPVRVQFWHKNVHLSANHSSAFHVRRAVIGWEVFVFMAKSYTFRSFEDTIWEHFVSSTKDYPSDLWCLLPTVWRKSKLENKDLVDGPVLEWLRLLCTRSNTRGRWRPCQ